MEVTRTDPADGNVCAFSVPKVLSAFQNTQFFHIKTPGTPLVSYMSAMIILSYKPYTNRVKYGPIVLSILSATRRIA